MFTRYVILYVYYARVSWIYINIIIVSLRVDHLNGVEDVAIFSFVVRFVESVSALIVHIYHT